SGMGAGLRRRVAVLRDDLAETLTDAAGDLDERGGFGGRKVGAAVAAPEFEPGGKVAFFEAEREVFPRHAAGVETRSAGDAGPEVGDLLQMRRPVLDVGGKDGRD